VEFADPQFKGGKIIEPIEIYLTGRAIDEKEIKITGKRVGYRDSSQIG
jgi:S-adenosylmethionine synthetase (AdoMet synthetase).